MTRFFLEIEYDGTPLQGWQQQGGKPTVQEHLAQAIERVFGERIYPTGAGRTDAGVHATAQVAHFDVNVQIRPEKIPLALNAHLRETPVRVLTAWEGALKSHARFSATSRSYTYIILNRRSPSILRQNHCWHMPQPLDIACMIEEAHHLMGSHDFSSFRDTRCQATHARKTLDVLEVIPVGELIYIHARSRSFLHHQVRNMVGTLVWKGLNKLPLSIADILMAQDRRAAGPTAPAGGLFFTGVTYPDRTLFRPVL